MPEFDDAVSAGAPPEDVWKLLFDPAQFPRWSTGIETVERGPAGTGYTLYPTGYPDFPMPQAMAASSADRRVRISCLVSDLRFEWTLEPLGPQGTTIRVHVEIPGRESHRLEGQRAAISSSLRRLAALATAESGATPAVG
jgi:uncharacterized protein YndB with AHSA1/START domain